MTPERDEFSTSVPVIVIEPAVYSADNTPPAVDMLTYHAATIYLSVGIGGVTFNGTNKIEFVLTHSSDGTTYTNVTAADIIVDNLAPATISNGIVRSLTSTHAASDVQAIGYIGGKRYVKLLADFSGTHATGTPISAVMELEQGALRRAY